MRQFLLAIDLVDITGDDIKVGLKRRRRLIRVLLYHALKRCIDHKNIADTGKALSPVPNPKTLIARQSTASNPSCHDG